MATLAEDIASYLQSKAIVIGYGVDCFSDVLPEGPDHVFVIYEYPSEPPSPFMVEVHRSLQIITRDKNPDISKSWALNAYKALLPINESLRVDFTTERFGQVYLREIPFKLSTDGNDRVIYCFNIGITTTID